MELANKKIIGVFGGTFDPVHLAHLRLAEEIQQEFLLDELRLVPSADPPHRATPDATVQQRLAMLTLALRGNQSLKVDDR